MENNFLLKEYELCFEQLRYYDNRQSNLLQYLFTLSSAVATAQFAVYKFLKAPTQGFYICQAFLGSIVFIATLLLFLSMLQNRLYFVYIARQLNAIREYFLKIESPDFHKNQLYTSTDFPALKASSVHTFQLFGAALISGLFFGITFYGFQNTDGNKASIGCSLIVSIIVAISELLGGAIYLKVTGEKTADVAIHGKTLTTESPNNCIEGD